MCLFLRAANLVANSAEARNFIDELNQARSHGFHEGEKT